MKMLHKSFRIKIAVKEDPANPDARTIEGWASTFGNTDSQNDIVMPGAFAESLKTRMPKMLWQHNSDQPCGIWDSATETPQGLYVKGRVLNTSIGNDAYELLKAGAIDTMSIGYSVIDATWDYESGIRSLKEVELWEVSLVTFPANEQAKITTVKAMAEDLSAAHGTLEQAAGICAAYMSGDMAPTKEAFGTVHDHIKCAQKMLLDPEDDDADGKAMSKIELEKHLRQAGFSRADARGIVAKGYPALTEQREAASEKPKDELANLFNQFR
jgi:HK97 family phage prohead protease